MRIGVVVKRYSGLKKHRVLFLINNSHSYKKLRKYIVLWKIQLKIRLEGHTGISFLVKNGGLSC